MIKIVCLLLAITVISTVESSRCGHYPRYPQDFRFSYRGIVNGWTCIRIIEPSDPIWKNGNSYFCHKAGPQFRGVGMRWSYAGAIRGMKCFRVFEPSEPRHYHWRDNYICVPANSPYNLRFYNSNPKYARCRCVQWLKPSDPHTWRDNWLCTAK
ncbi:uncharacterized protein [Clytia hemisphaerica]|uniref:uncharacterized protein n=1 Tax=Clytia hemisphaerica TaxID=252671 RepID=UPI0034D709B9